MLLLKQCWKFKNGSKRIALSRSGTYSSGREQRRSIWRRAWPGRMLFSRALVPGEHLPPCMSEGAGTCPLFTTWLPKPLNMVLPFCFLSSLSSVSQSHTITLLAFIFQAHSSGPVAGRLYRQLYLLCFSYELMTLIEWCLTSYRQPQNHVVLSTGSVFKANASHFGFPWTGMLYSVALILQMTSAMFPLVVTLDHGFLWVFYFLHTYRKSKS